MSSRKLLIDGDVIAYKAGFAAETRFYELNNEKYNSVKEAKKIKEIEGGDIFAVQELKSENSWMFSTVNILNRIQMNLESNDMTVVLSGKTNFRKELYSEYKANRAKNLTPLAKDDIIEYMKSNYNCVVSDNEEADDLLGILQCRYNTSNDDITSVICSIDKDLLMIPGEHYNLNTQEIITATDSPGELWLEEKKRGDKNLKGTGFKWFCAQTLLGDKVDNIPGIDKIGNVRAYNHLKTCKTNMECWEKVTKI